MSHHSAGATAPSTHGGECKIEMLWNWNVMDSCFLASSWHIKSNAMFAASCIGVAFLVVCLEFLRRLSKEHDAYLHRKFQRHLRLTQAQLAAASTTDYLGEQTSLSGYATYRASPLQQLCRAVIHGVTLGVAYIVMLLAMHYNGYVIISIIIGATIGKFLCDWMVIRIPYSSRAEPVRSEKSEQSSVDVAGPTGCCA